MRREPMTTRRRGYREANGRSDIQLLGTYITRKTDICLIMAMAMIAFEVFN
jgi:hypothetical protein